ncbi:hypothetical protein [Paraburkholderia nodosa]|uniref:hypothetical protein n=1 Tax=Paraburkholderia nodosa TaxID=392320 RepID=UPI0004B449E2|nr:hypothetical protein [Paraburkholderia nodosa]
MSDYLIELARASGMSIQLDAVIGREHYWSVSGSLDALERFAEAYSNEKRAAHKSEQKN